MAPDEERGGMVGRTREDEVEEGRKDSGTRRRTLMKVMSLTYFRQHHPRVVNPGGHKKCKTPQSTTTVAPASHPAPKTISRVLRLCVAQPGSQQRLRPLVFAC